MHVARIYRVGLCLPFMCVWDSISSYPLVRRRPSDRRGLDRSCIVTVRSRALGSNAAG